MKTSVKTFAVIGMMASSAMMSSAMPSSSYETYYVPMTSGMMAAAPDGEGDVPAQLIVVELESAGSLGTEVMYKVEKLEDVLSLKVKGTLNAADWTTLKNMKNLQYLDLSEAKATAMPANEFYGRSSLKTILLPEILETIGNYAFQGTSIEVIEIPASVKTLGENLFYEQTKLKEVKFKEGSVLTSIGYRAYYGCTALEKFLMPNTVTALGNQAFYGCTKLSNLSLSTSLTEISEYCFYNTKSLKGVVFPEGLRTIGEYAFYASGLENAVLPIGLTTLGYEAFRECYSLKHVELPAYATYNNYVFRYCTALQTVVSPSCTPPATSNAFYNVDRSKVTLKVPSFAVVDYKLDTYWLNFGTIEAMETDPVSWTIANGKLSLTNNRRPTNTPNIEIYTTCSMVVGGNAPFEVGNFVFNFNPSSPAYSRLVNRSPMSVSGTVRSYYYAQKGTWYFLAPFTDVAVADITHGANASFVFRYYDTANRATNGTNKNANWKNVTDDRLKAGQGYIFQCNADGWVRLPATEDSKAKAFTSANVTLPLSAHASDNAANANWNFVGNPYPCYYDVWYMDFTAPITVREGSSYKAYSIVDDNFILTPMQAFFVQKSDNVDKILFKEEGRQIESTTNRVASARHRAADASRRLYNITLSDGVNTDMTRTILNEQASLGYEMTCDAAKFMSSDQAMPQLYTIDDSGNSLAFNERPLADGLVRLGFYAGAAGAYTLSLEGTDDNVTLTDRQTGKTVSLANPYHFDVEAPGAYDDRFTLAFARGNTTAIQEQKAATANVSVVTGGIEVGAEGGAEIAVYRTDGSLYLSAKAQAGVTRIQLPAGLYLVTVAGKTFKSLVH